MERLRPLPNPSTPCHPGQASPWVRGLDGNCAIDGPAPNSEGAARLAETLDDTDVRELRPRGALADYLVVALECDRPHAGSAKFALDGIDQVIIGRAAVRGATRREQPVRTLHLGIPGSFMSESHARLIRVGYAWAVEDHGSKNGTFVDGGRVSLAVLDPDSTLEVGHTFLRIHPGIVPEEGPKDLDPSGVLDGYTTMDGGFAEEIARVEKLVAASVPALLVGESGTGKEVLARRLHERSGCRGSFVAVNCGAIPAALVESQLFGHVKGAFSGAVRDEIGYIRAAQGGTLLLDEIADLAQESQAALLRVLQEREVIPVGSTKPIPVELRLLAATHAPLESLVDRGEFRQDLYARIAGSVITIPPLRERRDDMGTLVATLLSRFAASRELTFTPDVGRALLAHDWPFNVRELEQCLATSLALATSNAVDTLHLPPRVADASRIARRAPSVARHAAPGDADASLRIELLAQLSRHRGNIVQVARAMGKARTQIHRWCRRFNVDPRVFRD
jgi:hypothetical protein